MGGYSDVNDIHHEESVCIFVYKRNIINKLTGMYEYD